MRSRDERSENRPKKSRAPFFRSISRTAGMSLLEVIIAVLLTLVAFLGIAKLMAIGISSANRSKVSTSTVSLAQQGMESIQSQSFSALNSPTSPTYFDQYGNSTDAGTGANYASDDSRVRYIRTLTVTTMDSMEKEITVNVRALRSPYGVNVSTTTFTTRRVNY